MEYRAHYFSHVSESWRPVFSLTVRGNTVQDAREVAIGLLPYVPRAIGLWLVDGADQQVDLYSPPQTNDA